MYFSQRVLARKERKEHKDGGKNIGQANQAKIERRPDN
jgi:hypothetical protein